MDKIKIQRINELAKKAKSAAGLTAEETEERDKLRREYIEDVKHNLRVQLDNMEVEHSDGSISRLKRKI